MLAPILKMSSVVKEFPGVKALDDAHLNIYPGRVMALLGENGAGKSTLMKVMTGIYQKDAGSLFYQGVETNFRGPKDSQERGVSIIHQELNLIPGLSIAENIFLGREPVGAFGRIDWHTLYAESQKLLDMLNVQYSPKTLVGQLSIGEQQMVEIAKALSFSSSVIVMDEPTDALTERETESLFNVIRQLRAEGKGIVYISHRLKEILEICDDATVMRDGRFIAEAPVSNLTEDRIIELMVGRSLEEQYPRIDVCAADELILDVQNLCAKGVDNVSFQLRAGEILGISGLMGAGRTELVKALYGANPLKSGIINVSGNSVDISTPAHGLQAGVVYISEDRKGDGLIVELGVRENMSLCSLKQFSGALGVDRKKESSVVHGFIQRFNIKTPSADQLIKNLSGGNQQKVAIAKGLMLNPKVLIVDEPTRGVDVGARKEIYQLMNEFKAKGMSIIMVSSDMPEVLGMSDRILVMHDGKVTGEFTHREATQEKLMRCAVGHQAEAA